MVLLAPFTNALNMKEFSSLANYKTNDIMQWKYTPISVRFLSTNSFASSGVSLILTDGMHVVEEYNLTITTIPQAILNKCQIVVTNDSLSKHQTNEITWYETNIAFNFSLDIDDIQSFRSHGFKFVPQDHPNNTSPCLLNLSGTTPLHKHLKQYKPIAFVDVQDYVPIEIFAYPFSFTNPLVFSKFKIHGHINYFNNVGYLSDIKYLENILGGVVNLATKSQVDQSIGMVVSNLRKFNGDGDLTYIISWKVIWSTINFPNDFRLNKLLGLYEVQPNIKANTSIVPIFVNNTHQTWGSCIIFNSQYLITNHHVLKPTFTTKSQVTVKISNDIITLTEDDDIITPFNADLSFIRLSSENQSKLANSANIPVEYTTDYDIHDDVQAISYGLFCDVSPLVTFGHIQAIKSLPLESTHGPISTRSLLISSASCWNGSSGGALFKQGKMIGIICSNAQVKFLDLNTNTQLLEKLTKLSFILPIDLILKFFEPTKYKVLVDFEHLWNLIPFHKDVIAKL